MQSDEYQIRRIMGRFYKPWYRRPLPWLFALMLAMAAGRVALTPLADHWTRQALAELTSFRAEYRELSLFSFPPVAVIDGLAIEGHDGLPVASVERVELHTHWGDVLRAVLFDQPPTVRVRVARPRVVLTGEGPVFLAEEIRDWLDGRRNVHVELASIEDGDIQVGAVGSARSETWMNELQATIEQARPTGAPTVIKGKAALLGSGDTSFKIELPASDDQAVSGELQVSYLSLADLYLFLDGTPPAHDAAPGTLAVGARFKVTGSEVTGVVRTSTSGVRAADLPPPLIERLRVRLSAAAPFIEAQRKRTSDPAEFALRGTVSPARAGQWLKALTAARAFFVEGVGGAVASLPPAPRAPESEPSQVVPPVSTDHPGPHLDDHPGDHPGTLGGSQ